MIFFIIILWKNKTCLYVSDFKTFYEWSMKDEPAMFVEILHYIANLEVKVALSMFVFDLHQD